MSFQAFFERPLFAQKTYSTSGRECGTMNFDVPMGRRTFCDHRAMANTSEDTQVDDGERFPFIRKVKLVQLRTYIN